MGLMGNNSNFARICDQPEHLDGPYELSKPAIFSANYNDTGGLPADFSPHKYGE